MIPFRYTRGEERHFLDSSFEPDGDGFLFYRSHWSRGVPVTAEERALYLRPPLEGSRRDFYRRIEGRPATGPRRGFWRSQLRTAASIPVAIGWALAATGIFFLWRSGAVEDFGLQWLFRVAGVTSALYGSCVLLARLFVRR